MTLSRRASEFSGSGGGGWDTHMHLPSSAAVARSGRDRRPDTGEALKGLRCRNTCDAVVFCDETRKEEDKHGTPAPIFPHIIDRSSITRRCSGGDEDEVRRDLLARSVHPDLHAVLFK